MQNINNEISIFSRLNKKFNNKSARIFKYIIKYPVLMQWLVSVQDIPKKTVELKEKNKNSLFNITCWFTGRWLNGLNTTTAARSIWRFFVVRHLCWFVLLLLLLFVCFKHTHTQTHTLFNPTVCVLTNIPTEWWLFVLFALNNGFFSSFNQNCDFFF